jgi:integrase
MAPSAEAPFPTQQQWQSLQLWVRIDGRDAFINRLGRWSDPVAVAVAVAKAHAIAAQI